MHVMRLMEVMLLAGPGTVICSGKGWLMGVVLVFIGATICCVGGRAF
jgi:hypothetical protein